MSLPTGELDLMVPLRIKSGEQLNDGILPPTMEVKRIQSRKEEHEEEEK